MDFNKYIYSLRIALRPNDNLDADIDRLTALAVKYDYRDVMFYINNTCTSFLTHITEDEARSQVEAIKRAKKVLNAAGITVSVNPGTSLGQQMAEGLREGQNFQPITSPAGKTSGACCPLDDSFREYLSDLFAYYAREIQPEIIWIEDDFRMHNRFGSDWGGCFCPLHMKKYCEYLGFEISRDDFVKELLRDDVGKSPYRDAYMFVTRKAMEDFAAEVGRKVRAVCPTVRLGFMTSHPEEHAIEYRDWARLFQAGDPDLPPIDRINLPNYEQCAPQVYGWNFNKISVQTRARIPNDTIVLPEQENGVKTPFTKSVNFTRMQIEAASVLVPKGITLAIDNEMILPRWKYGDECARLLPYLQAIQDTGIDFSSLEGVIVPFSKETVRNMKPTDYFTYLDHLKPDDSFFAGLLSAIGVSYKYVEDPIDVCGKVVAVSGQWFRNFTEDRIKNFFANNRVILNADAVLTLLDMGLGRIVGIKSAEWNDPLSHEKARFEQADERFEVNGIRDFYSRVPQYLNIGYERDYVPYSRVFGAFDKLKGVGQARVGDVFIYPFKGEFFDPVKMAPIREAAIKDFVSGGMTTDGTLAAGEIHAVGDNPSFIINAPMVSPYYYANKRVLMVCNFLDDDAEAKFYAPSGFSFKEIEILDRDGIWEKCDYVRKGKEIGIENVTFRAMSTTVLRLI